jgi:hypothetical protein
MIALLEAARSGLRGKLTVAGVLTEGSENYAGTLAEGLRRAGLYAGPVEEPVATS